MQKCQDGSYSPSRSETWALPDASWNTGVVMSSWAQLPAPSLHPKLGRWRGEGAEKHARGPKRKRWRERSPCIERKHNEKNKTWWMVFESSRRAWRHVLPHALAHIMFRDDAHLKQAINKESAFNWPYDLSHWQIAKNFFWLYMAIWKSCFFTIYGRFSKSES